MKKYSRLSSAVVLIGALRDNNEIKANALYQLNRDTSKYALVPRAAPLEITKYYCINPNECPCSNKCQFLFPRHCNSYTHEILFTLLNEVALEMVSTLKRKEFAPGGANSFLSGLTPTPADTEWA